MRIGKYVWFCLVEYWGHADYSLRSLEVGFIFQNRGMNQRDAYSGWNFPFVEEKRTVAGKALMSSNFAGTQSSGGGSAGTAAP